MTESIRQTEISTTRADLEAAVARAAREMGAEPAALTLEILSETPEGMQVRLTTPEGSRQLSLARETLGELLAKMCLPAEIAARWVRSEDSQEQVLWLDLEGDDLSVLTSRRGEPLAALQYVLRLMLGRELESGVSLVVDVAGHRQRRIAQLQRLATRMAEQAVQRQRVQSLEPMSASDRRVIHLALREYPGVRTESVGEGDRRKVTIIPASA